MATLRDSIHIDRLIPGEHWLDLNKDDEDWEYNFQIWLDLKKAYETITDLLHVDESNRDKFRERAVMSIFDATSSPMGHWSEQGHT